MGFLKVQQNIGKQFRNMAGAQRFLDLRGFISTARKNGMRAAEALNCLFRGEVPYFMRE